MLKKHLPFVIMLIVLAAYLGLKAIPENGWDGWSQGSAQSLITIKHWNEDGFIYSKFLQIPNGNGKVVRYFDEPTMRHHAHGTIAGGLIGQRLYYTHYPSFSLIPPALLMKLGFEKRYWFRFFELAISLGALVLMYWFFNLISSRAIAFFSVLYYGISEVFLNFADSIGGSPFDDLFRFGVLVLSVLALKSVTEKQYRYYTFFIWLAYFFASLVSFDYQFFIFVWLVGLDIIIKRKFLWKKWLFFASAPILAFLLLIVQNYWYFGNWHEVFLDFYGAGREKGLQITSLYERRESVFYTLFLMSGAGFKIRDGFGGTTNNFAALLSLAALMGFYILKKPLKYSWPSKNILILLFLSGAIWPFLAKGPAHFEYQGRQMAPFLGLLTGSGAVLLFYRLKKIFSKRLFKRVSFILILFAFSVISLWLIQMKITISYIRNWPNNIADSGMIEGLKSVKSQYQEQARGKEIAFFILRGHGNPLTESIIDQEQRYPQVPSITEYYAGAPILSFSDPKDLVDDLIWLKKRSEYDFFPIILLPDNKELMRAIQKEIDMRLNEL